MTSAERMETTEPFLPIALALEGGGAMDAFSWGVIERLLDEPGLRIEAISGTSGGALNAALLAQGLGSGGPPEAKHLLETMWNRVAASLVSIPGPMGLWLDHASALMAPLIDAMRETTEASKQTVAAWMPGIGSTTPHPLRKTLTGLLDTDVFGRPGVPNLMVAATSARTGKARLFRDHDVTMEALLASSCLPQKFEAIEIEGEAYWDGCYASNPPLLPLIEAGCPKDVILVRVAPFERPELATTLADIKQRVSELAFGAALQHDFQALARAQTLPLDSPGLPLSLARLRDVRLHIITAEADFQDADGGSSQDPTWAFLDRMRTLGQKTAKRWLEANRNALGQHATADLKALAGP